MSKILRLTLKKKWFDMIVSGEKKQEYREVKQYWINRLTNQNTDGSINGSSFYKQFDFVEFKNGYQNNAPTITLVFEGIEIGSAKPEWSDNWEGDFFIIKLGLIVNR